MYNVGFGDCFLLFLPTAGGLKKVAIDCGSLKNKKHSIRTISDRLIKDVTDDDGIPRIDVLVMSHRHADHISGYTNANWADVEVGEVWMPWLESREDPDARAIQKRQRAAAQALAVAVQKLGLGQGLAEVALNAQSNDDSLDVLHAGFAKAVKPRFFPSSATKVVEKIVSDALPELEIFVLGPPHDRRALNRPDPPEGQILLTGYSADSLTGPLEKLRPFSGDWVDENSYWPDFDPGEIDRAASRAEMYETAAAKLDADINNTSLILIFRVGKHYLLFPGDAQWGPWEKILSDDEAVELLRKVTFLKVSHHASHNGTPATLLKEILGKANKRDGIVHAMISMTPFAQWEGIPHDQILTTLDELGFPYAISDVLKDQDGFTRDGDFCFDLKLT
jgi:beta-lactamase superfamily II metal-dependent hydrolase